MIDTSMPTLENSQNPAIRTFADEEILGIFNLLELGTDEERNFYTFLNSQTTKQSNSHIEIRLSNNTLGGGHAKLEFNP